MNIRDLKYLVALSETKHFRKAAEQCYVSQPALSMQIQKLEDSLGITLFERSNREVIITDIGREIINKAKELLLIEKEIYEIADNLKNPLSGNLRIGAFPTLAPYIFPKIVPKIHAELNELKLFLIEEKTNNLIYKLENGEIDIALLALPIENTNLDYIELFDDYFYLAVSQNHKLASKKNITYDELSNTKLLLLEEGHCLRNHALDVCSIIGINEKEDFRATSLETLRQMVIADIGITLIPEIAKKNNDNIIYIPFIENNPKRTIAIVYRKTFHKTEIIDRIKHIIKNTIAH